jgi:hypothetical protein
MYYSVCTLHIPRPNWDPPTPSTPSETGVGGVSQFGRLEKKPITLSTLCSSVSKRDLLMLADGRVRLEPCISNPCRAYGRRHFKEGLFQSFYDS